jgi:hypothetical protein
MNVKNYLKLHDIKSFQDGKNEKGGLTIIIRTWDIFNGFRNWHIEDKEIQTAKVSNVVYYKQNNEIEIQAVMKR